MKTNWLLFAAVLLLVAGCKKKEKAALPITTVEVTTPMVDSVVLHKTYPGYIRAMNTYDIVARVNGVILKQYFTEGDYVREGQLLYAIDPSKYQDLANQARAALKTAESQYEYAARQYEAMNKALKADAVSQMEVIQAESNMNVAKASIQNAKAALSTALENLSYCTIRAPRSGRIKIGAIGADNYVNGEGAPVTLTTIYDDSKVKASFEIEDGQYEKMLGDNSTVENNLLRHIPLIFEQDLPHKYTADLVYTSPNVNSSTGTLTLDGHIDNPYGELKDGMYVTVNLPYDTDPKAILINNASIGTDQLGKYVYVVNDSNKVVYTPIEIGEIYRDTLCIVTKGLTPKDRYVTKALLTVRNGMTVNPVEKNTANKTR